MAEVTPDAVDDAVRKLSGSLPARMPALEWLLKMASSGELRDVEPGFSDNMYVLWGKALLAAVTDTEDDATPPEPATMPPPSDKGIFMVSSSKPPAVRGVKRPAAMPPKARAPWAPSTARGRGSAGAMMAAVPLAGPTQGPALAKNVEEYDPAVFFEKMSWLFPKLTVLPEFDTVKATAACPPALAAATIQRLWSTTHTTEHALLKAVLYWLYSNCADQRAPIRLLLGRSLVSFVKAPRITPAINTVLELLCAIVSGFSGLNDSHLMLLQEVLLPLHTTNAFLTELEALLALYHKQLVLCLLAFLKHDPGLILGMVQHIVNYSWPTGLNANSPKEVLLVHELETLCENTDQVTFGVVLPHLIPVLLRCCTSDNSRVNQRCLQMFANAKVVEFCTPHAERLLTTIMPVLLKDGELHWSGTVNKMRATLLGVFQDMDAVRFEAVADDVLGLSPEAAAGGSRQGMGRAAALMARMKPAVAGELTPAEREAVVLTETPTLRPELMFHDLAFGRELGSGSFSIVKYAKCITKGAPATSWPEYAVKVISVDAIRRLGYESSVQRELAVLRVLSHPGLARLVASFRWRGSAYFVLEFASKGDLHTHITTTMGSLDESSTRFVIGEVVAALASIHDAGFVYGDLKPENIVLTASGHAKLTDFGAVRPFSATAKVVIEKAKDAIKSLRDGDWRAKAGLPPSTDVVGLDGKVVTGGAGAGGGEELSPAIGAEDDAANANRLEGTAAYLSPEVVKGGSPTIASDCWALGCVLYQCLTGRPPVWAETDADVMARIVCFDFDVNDSFPADFPPVAKDLVVKLLDPNPDTRLGGGPAGLATVKAHPFFSGVDVDTLFTKTPPPLAQGTAGPPAPDAAWSRRQNSMMWSPMPTKYTAAQTARSLAPVPETPVEARAPFVTQLTPLPETVM